ncbi:M28 family peptidase [uncultured Paracoccus sp.]|uniref:M28 family peptidase n=1 Tax=uncultured Paracoccus sp. TaxID=189685 RepID=UPI0025DF569D|nr:M28 family peptidase [uncultured Paracoccus sp.]
MPRRTLAFLATSTLLAAPAVAQEFGDHAFDTIWTLSQTYQGRYTGSTVFPQAADYMSGRLSFGANSVTRQDFTTTRGPSQNLLVTMEGESETFIVVGAHFDSAGTSDNLQGVDDNASGAAVLTELAAHMSGIDTGTGLVFTAFGAEEIGLVGSRHYVDSLTDRQRENIAGMINIDSLITGDHMYAHAGTNIERDPALKSFWTQAHAIAREMGIDLRSNPGRNADYPKDTGCCSDAAPFQALDIPVLWLESTNWDLGDLDGYVQTDNPAIPGGATWHTPELDNWEVLTGAFGEDRIPGRMQDYTRLLTRLLVEVTDADLIASVRAAGQTAALGADLVARQHEDLTAGQVRQARARLDQPAEIGRLTPHIAVEGLSRPRDSGVFGTSGGGALSATAGASYQMSDMLGVGGFLSYRRAGDDTAGDTELEAKTIAAGVDLAWRRDAAWAVAAASYGGSSLSGDRQFVMTSGLGTEILRRDLDLDTDARTWGIAAQGGLDLGDPAGLSYGPVAGLDYSRTSIDAFTEGGGDRRAVRYGKQSFDSLEVQLGGQVRQTIALSGRDVTLSGRAVWVAELADGRPDSIRVTDSEGTARRLSIAGADDSFGRVGLAAEARLSPQASGWVTLDGRIGHDGGSQVALGAGVGLRF